ncbi:hypothetical protein JL721_4583 [Aureococcus anophagefferens]|nr:hypothetical protein JL721_4583 [Aureococcus anophagefferens]
MDDDKTLAGCVAGGRDLRLGTGSILVLERRLTRQLVADLHATRFANPKIDEAPVGSPLVIVGPPRSGTTLLLELLACDGDTWRQLAAPDATTPCAVGGPSTARAVAGLTEGLLGGQQYMFDKTKHIHYEHWAGPTECRTALENGCGAPYVLWWVFGLTDRLDAWMDDEADRDRDYAFYKAQLGVVKACGDKGLDDPRDWLLKDPAHLFSLGSLFKALPDAKVMTDLVADPIANVREIYAFAGKDLSDATVAKMQAYLDANKRDGRAGHHKYDCRDFGLEKDAINARFAAYKARFDL